MPETAEELLEWDIKKLWECFKMLMQQENEDGRKMIEEYKEENDKIKNGTIIKIPIYYITNEWYEEYPSSGRVKIYGFGKYMIESFEEEKEKRETLMREIISENMDTGGTTIPRN